MTLSALCSGEHSRALEYRLQIPGMAAALLGGRSVGDLVADLASRTVCLTLLAGSGSRWVKSVVAAGIDPGVPRGLYPVRDFIRPASSAIPVAAYSLMAVDDVGRHLIVVRGWEDRIRAEILEPLGIGPGRYAFFTQEAPFGKPLGHGDATWQCRDAWSDAEYVVTNFGGDPNSGLTVICALLALDALSASEHVDLILPAARVDNPAYPIDFDRRGLPVSFGHAKLQGRAQSEASGFANVGVRVYRAKALREKASSIRERFWRDDSGYSIPGNDPAGHEFALDNIDAEFAAEGRARVLACATPDELAPIKSLGDVAAFEAAIGRVTAEWKAIRPGLFG